MNDLWSYIRPLRRRLAVLSVISLVAAAASLAQPLVVQAAITSIEAGQGVDGGLVAGICGLLLVATLLTTVQHYFLSCAAENTVLNARRRIISKLLRMPIIEHDRARIGDLLSRLTSDTSLLRSVITSGLLDVVSATFVMVGATVAMLVISPSLFGFVLLVIISVSVLIGVLSGKVRSLTVAAQEAVGEMSADTERALGAVRTIRASNNTSGEIERIMGAATTARDAGVRVSLLLSFIAPVSSIAGQVSFLVVLGFGGARVATGQISIADLITFLLFLFMLMQPIGQLVSANSVIQNALAAVSRIRDLTELPDEVDCLRPIRPAEGETRKSSHHLISFKEARFSYPEGPAVLTGLNLEIEKGTFSALVGRSGAGKSTIFSLIERFYDVEDSQVFWHGRDVNTISRSTIRDQIAYVEQSSPVLSGTLKENLLLGQAASDSECWDALGLVDLQHLASGPSGMDISLGDRGIKLSGGERQRITLARCLLTEKSLILLDEPTSNLDGHNEALFQKALRNVAKEKSLVIIAHRLSTVRHADTIYVIEYGKCTAQGSHEDLMSSSRHYNELAQAQLMGVSP